MQRAVAVVILAMLAALSAPAQTPSNPGFETNLAGWTLWSGPGSNADPLERDHVSLSGTPYGFWSLGIKGIGTGGKGAFTHVAAGWQPGRRYRITARAKAVVNTQLAFAVGYRLGAGGAGDGPTATYGATVARPGVWTEVSVELTYSGAAGVTIYLKAVNDGQSERAGFDEVAILDLGPAGPTPTATETSMNQSPTPTPSATLPPAGFTFPGFAYSQLLAHFREYHERSECIYLGNGSWASIESNLSHSLVRDQSRRAQGYMRAFRVDPQPVYEQRTRAALEWLLADQKPDGHFTWWITPQGVDNRFDCQYTTAEGGCALAEGYAMFGDARYLQASARAAQWLSECELVWNTNYVMFAMWHLAKHYGISGEARWLDAAVYRAVNCGLPLQDTDGGWREGPGAPSDLIGHNKRIWYHGIILRAMCELYRVLPAGHPIRGQVYQSVQRAAQRAAAMQQPWGEIAVGAGVPNEHRNAFILEALLLALRDVGIDTRDTVRGVMRYRLDPARPPYQDVFNIDLQAVGLMMELYSVVVPEAVPSPTPAPIPTAPVIANPAFEADGGFFGLARHWLRYGYGKREGFQEAGRGWVQGVADYPEGKLAGVYQFVGGVAPGGVYRVRVDARMTSSQLEARLGVAPRATHDRHAATFSGGHSGAGWQTLTVDVMPTEPWLTIFLEGRNLDAFRISFERVLFDNVRLEQLAAPPPADGALLSAW